MEMNIGMNDIDFRLITQEVVKSSCNMPLEHPGGFFSRSPVKINVTPGMVREMLLGGVWRKCVELLNLRYHASEPMAIEKALSELMKNGLIKDKIIFRKDSFRLNLQNGQYRAYKMGPEGTVCACPWPSEWRYEIQFPGKVFAEFVLLFDAEIPEIVSHIPEVIEAVRKREMEGKKEQIEKELKETFIKSLIEQYLTPSGISARYSFQDGDMVSLDLSQSLTAHLDIPLWELAEKLKDPEQVRALLQVNPSTGTVTDEEYDDTFFP